ncbi:MAG: TonB family protein [Bacteroidota bacterium]
MENKKNEKYDLERKRPLFFGIGLMITFTLVISAFEWRTEIDPICLFCEEELDLAHDVILDIAPATAHERPQPPKPKVRPEVIQVVEAANELEETIEVIIKQEEEVPDSFDDVTIEVPVIKEEAVDETPRNFAEVMPSFEGGMNKFYEFVAKNTSYPRTASRIGAEGRVLVKFIVEKDGSLSNIEVLRGIGAGLDEEALRVMNLVPNFTPGKQGDVRVRVSMVVPINFKLN